MCRDSIAAGRRLIAGTRNMVTRRAFTCLKLLVPRRPRV